MQDAGDSDSGGLEKTAPSEDSGGTVELRKSCDYCVRLKRACDGKNPCSLCLRRHKPCTRSARKKSGPAKGTKYAPRRKRSVIAEWADRAAFGAREHAQLHGPLSSPFGTMGVAGGGGQVGGGGGGAYGGAPPLHIHSSQAEAARAAMPFPMSHPQVRRRADAWGDPAVAAATMPGGRGPPPLPPPPPPSNLPIPDWYVKQELSASRTEPGGGGAHRRLAPRLDPPPSGLAPDAGEGALRRLHVTPSSWSAPPMETPPRQGLSRFETVATAAGLQVGGVMEAGPGSGPGRLQGQGEGERAPPPPPPPGARGRMWDPPPPDQRGSGQGMRPRLTPPYLPPDSARLLPRQGSDPYGPGALSPRGRGGDGGSAGPSPKRPRERDQEESSPPLLPPPREPPDPTAGFTFLPAAKLLSWRRPSPLAPWKPRTDFSGSSHTQSPPFDYSDRPASWSSAGGGGGGGGGSGARGGGGGDGGVGGASTAGRRYHEGHGGAAAEAQQGGGAQKMESFEWQLPSVETDTYRERYELPPPPRVAGRRLQPQERRISLGEGGSGSGGGGDGEGHDERQGEGYALEAVRSTPTSPGAGLEGGRRRSFGSAAPGASALERQLERPSGRFSPDTSGHRGGDTAGPGGQEPRHWEDQQRPDSVRRVPPPDVHGWERSHLGARVLSSPPMVMLPTPDAGGTVAPGGLGFEGASTTASSGLERAPRPADGSGGGGDSSMPYQWLSQQKSLGGGEERGGREEGGEGDRHLRAGGGPLAARSVIDTLGGAATTPTPRNSLEEGGRHGEDGASPRSSSLPGARDDVGREGTGGDTGGDEGGDSRGGSRGNTGGGDGRQWGGNNGESGRSTSLPYPRSRTGEGEPRAYEPPPPQLQQQQQQQQQSPSQPRPPGLAPPPQQQQQQQSPPRQWMEGREEAWRPEWGDQIPPGGFGYPPLSKKDGSG